MPNTNQAQAYSPDYSGYVSVLERVPIEERRLEARPPACVELSRWGHTALASATLVVLLLAPVLVPPAQTLAGILVGEVSRAPWAEIVQTRPVGVGVHSR